MLSPEPRPNRHDSGAEQFTQQGARIDFRNDLIYQSPPPVLGDWSIYCVYINKL